MSPKEARWSTSQLEGLIQETVTELSETLHEIENRGMPSLSDTAVTLNRLHQYIEEFRSSIAEDCIQYGINAEEAQQSLQGLMKVARRLDEHRKKLQGISLVLEDLQRLNARNESYSETVHSIKLSSVDLLEELSSLSDDTTDEYLERTAPFVALHRWLTEADLSDEDWEHLSSTVASGLSKSLSIAVQRGRLYIAARAVREELELDSSLVHNSTTT